MADVLFVGGVVVTYIEYLRKGRGDITIPPHFKQGDLKEVAHPFLNLLIPQKSYIPVLLINTNNGSHPFNTFPFLSFCIARNGIYMIHYQLLELWERCWRGFFLDMKNGNMIHSPLLR